MLSKRNKQNYRAMNLRELISTLRKRKLGHTRLYSELNKVYGVAYLPRHQADARKEAIDILEADDQKRSTATERLIAITTLAVATVPILLR